MDIFILVKGFFLADTCFPVNKYRMLLDVQSLHLKNIVLQFYCFNKLAFLCFSI